MGWDPFPSDGAGLGKRAPPSALEGSCASESTLLRPQAPCARPPVPTERGGLWLCPGGFSAAAPALTTSLPFNPNASLFPADKRESCGSFHVLGSLARPTLGLVTPGPSRAHPVGEGRGGTDYSFVSRAPLLVAGVLWGNSVLFEVHSGRRVRIASISLPPPATALGIKFVTPPCDGVPTLPGRAALLSAVAGSSGHLPGGSGRRGGTQRLRRPAMLSPPATPVCQRRGCRSSPASSVTVKSQSVLGIARMIRAREGARATDADIAEALRWWQVRSGDGAVHGACVLG